MLRNDVRGTFNVPLITTVLGVGFVSGLIPAGLLPANVLNIEKAYGLSHSEMGRIVGLAMLFGGGLGGLIGGIVCGRIGAVRTICIALVMSAGGLGCTGLASRFVWTITGLTCYFFAGGFLGTSNVLATKMFTDRQRGLALLHGVNGVGKLIGPILASLFLYGAWRKGFIVAALVPLVLLLPALLALRDGRANSMGRIKADTNHAGIGFWCAMLGFALITGSEMAVALWTPAYAETARGFTAAQGNTLLAIFSVGFISGRFVAGALSKKLTPRQTIGVCGVLLVSAIPAVSVSSYPVAAVLFAVFGLSFSAMWPSYFAHLSHKFPEHLGMMGGGGVLTGQIGFAVCSSISGRIAEFNLAYALLFGAGTMAAFVVIFFLAGTGFLEARTAPSTLDP